MVVVVMVMMMGCGAVGLVVIGEPKGPTCYGSRLKGLSQETTLVLSNTRKLDRELFYKLVYFI